MKAWLFLLPAMFGFACGSPRKHVDLPSRNLRISKLEQAWPSKVAAAIDPMGRVNVAMTHGDTIEVLGADSATIPAKYAERMKLVMADSALHLFAVYGAGSGVQHWQRTGRGWQALPPLAVDQGGILGFDVVATGRGIVLALAVSAGTETPVRLVVSDHGQPDGYRELGRFPHPLLGSVGPRLATWRDEVHLVCSLNYARDYKDSLRNDGRLVHAFRSADAEWSAPMPIGRSYGYGDMALVGTRDRLFLFCTGWGLQARESLDGRHWSRERRLPAEGPGNVAAAADSDDVILTWFDVGISYLGFDRMSNDVFALKNTARPATLENIAGSPLIRVTPTSRFVLGVAAAGRRDIAWIAENEVGVAHIP